ncbi:MAG: hypothetical protein JWN28_446 [Candidatus Saccharibacteria bacterium]|nr:hypothetical protein [Candidatus Saccharibacteria bacterium]
MSDIDFDELDRAVNGALGTVSDPVTDTEPVTASTEPQTITRVERTVLSPVSDAPAPTPVPAPTPTPPPSPVSTAPAARRSSGRFMDMVHPSSDMRSRTTDAPAEKKPEVITPVAPAEPVVAQPQYTEPAAWNEPLESPFLPDTKVEKRPLGGGESLPTDVSAVSDTFDFQGLLDEPDEELLEAPEPQERLEATNLPDPIDFAAATAISEETELKTFEDEEPVKTEDVAVEPEPVTETPQPIIEAPQPIAEEPIGPTSITPQYKEQPSSNQETGAMYDTESYHQPVVQPVKKKSGWLTVFWIILLIILGAGAGWAIFTYVVPML